MIEKNWKEIIKPNKLEIVEATHTDTYARFNAQPHGALPAVRLNRCVASRVRCIGDLPRLIVPLKSPINDQVCTAGRMAGRCGHGQRGRMHHSPGGRIRRG